MDWKLLDCFTETYHLLKQTKEMTFPRQTSAVRIFIYKKKLENWEYFKYLCGVVASEAKCALGITSRIAMAKAVFNKEQSLFISKPVLNLILKSIKCHIVAQVSRVLKIGHFGQFIRNTWKVLRCGAGEGWRRSDGPIVCKTNKYYIESMSRGISYMQ